MRTNLVVFVVLALIIVAYTATAQESQKTPKPGFVVLNQNKIPAANVAKLNEFQDSIAAPILNDLMKEGKLLGWGQLDHAWGDEWNYNIYFITENHRAFLDFYSEYIARMNKKSPGWFQKLAPLFGEHKDNMYTIRVMR